MNKDKEENQKIIHTFDQPGQFSVIRGIEYKKITVQFIDKPVLQKIAQHLDHHLLFLQSDLLSEILTYRILV